MKLSHLIILQLLLYIFTETPMSWKIETINQSGTSSFYLYKGQYAKVRIRLTKPTSGFFQSGKVKLTLSPSDSDIFESLKEVELDPLEAFETYSFIGIKCGTNLNGKKEFTLTWMETSSEISIASISSFTINLYSFKKKIYIYQELYTVAMNTYSYITIDENYNLDNIEIQLDDSLGGTQMMTIPAFKNQRNNKDFYFQFKIGSVSTKTSVKYTLSGVNDCFTINNSFDVTVTTEKPAEFTDSSQKILVNSLQKFGSITNFEIALGVDIPSYPLLMSCMTTSSNREFIDEDIRRQYSNGNNDSYYIQSLLSYKTSNFRIEFNNLNFYNEYRAKCLFDTTALNKQTISFISGRMKNSDLRVALYPRYRNTNPAQCTTWRFKNELIDNDRHRFHNQTAEFCTRVFRKDPKFSPLEQGCISCSSRFIPNELNKASICIGSDHECQSTFFGNLTTVFETDFVNMLSTKQLILDNTNFDLEANDVESQSIDIDDIAPDKSTILGKVISKGLSVTFEVISHNDKTIECSYNKLNDKSLISIYGNELIQHTIILEKGIAKTIQVAYDTNRLIDMSVNLVFNCKNLPGYDKSYHQTGPFALVTFIDSSNQIEEDVEIKIDCNFNKFLPECIYKSKKIHFLNNYPISRINNEDEIDNFLRLNHIDQKLKFKLEIQQLEKLTKQLQIKATNRKKQINQMIKISELLSQYNCYSYNHCRQQKKEIHSKLLAILTQMFTTCPSFQSELITFGFDTFEENTKILFSLIETLTNNPDAINTSSDSNFITQLSLCLVNQFEEVWNKLKPLISGDEYFIELNKSDLLIMLTRIATNLIDINKFDQIDKFFDQTISDKFGHFTDEKPKKVKEIIDKSFSLFSQLNNTKFLFNDNDSIIAQLITYFSSFNYAYRIELDDYYIDIQMDYKKIIDGFKGQKMIILYYPYYPLFPMNSTVFDPKVISIKLVDNKGIEIPYDNRFVNTKPQIVLKEKNHLNNQFDDCYYYDFGKNNFYSDKSNFKVEDDINYCIFDLLSDFLFRYTKNDGLVWWAILLIVLGVLAFISIFVIVFIVIRNKKKNKAVVIQTQENILNEKQ